MAGRFCILNQYLILDLMSQQFPHDDFAKTYLTELLRPMGKTGRRPSHQQSQTQKTILKEKLPWLWLIMPTASLDIREGFDVGKNLSTVYLNLKEDWRQEGRQFTMQQVAIGLLQRQTDMDLILEITGLTRQQIQ